MTLAVQTNKLHLDGPGGAAAAAWRRGPDPLAAAQIGPPRQAIVEHDKDKLGARRFRPAERVIRVQ